MVAKRPLFKAKSGNTPIFGHTPISRHTPTSGNNLKMRVCPNISGVFPDIGDSPSYGDAYPVPHSHILGVAPGFFGGAGEETPPQGDASPTVLPLKPGHLATNIHTNHDLGILGMGFWILGFCCFLYFGILILGFWILGIHVYPPCQGIARCRG